MAALILNRPETIKILVKSFLVVSEIIYRYFDNFGLLSQKYYEFYRYFDIWVQLENFRMYREMNR